MKFLSLAKPLLALSALLLLASVVLMIVPGPRFSIEFTGGTLMEVRLPESKTKADVQASLETFGKSHPSLGNYVISALSNQSGKSFLIRMRGLSNEEHVALLGEMEKTHGQVQELQYTTIGPSLSSSLQRNALIALVVASVAIILYLAFAFRKMPRKLSPWKFGLLAVAAFIHDVILTCGLFVIIGRFTSFEFDPLFVTALLTILAYSANDTIVIFDRIRAALGSEQRSDDFAATVERGLRDCLTRTFNTMAAALIMLTSLFFLGSESIRWFILALIVGTLVGAYSSYFVAAPLLVFWSKDTKRR
jgi:preprotein translocase subunit SecF